MCSLTLSTPFCQKHVCCDAPSEVTHRLPVERTLVKMILGRLNKPHGCFDRSCPEVQPFQHKWQVYVLQKYSFVLLLRILIWELITAMFNCSSPHNEFSLSRPPVTLYLLTEKETVPHVCHDQNWCNGCYCRAAELH